MLSYNDLGKKKKKKRLEYQDRYSSEICLIFHVNPISGVWISVRLSHPSGISILSRETGRKNLGGNLRSHETGGGVDFVRKVWRGSCDPWNPFKPHVVSRKKNLINAKNKWTNRIIAWFESEKKNINTLVYIKTYQISRFLFNKILHLKCKSMRNMPNIKYENMIIVLSRTLVTYLRIKKLYLHLPKNFHLTKMNEY